MGQFMSAYGTIQSDYPAASRASRKQIIQGQGNSNVVSARKLLDRVNFDRGYIRETFEQQPMATASNGAGATSGTTGAVNTLLFPHALFEYVVLGAGQTIKTPVFTLDGLDISGDQTATEGFEYTNGNTVRCAQMCTIGTNVSRRILRFRVADVSGVNPLFVGFRGIQAYDTALANYTDLAGFAISGGLLYIYYQTGGAGLFNFSTGITVADNNYVQVQMDISKSGQCTFRASASAVQQTYTDMTKVVSPIDFGYTFTQPLQVIPSIFMLQAADLSGAINLLYYEAGNLV